MNIVYFVYMSNPLRPLSHLLGDTPTFSKELIDRAVKYFGEEHDHHISEETAIEYLNSMASLYLAFSKERRSESDK